MENKTISIFTPFHMEDMQSEEETDTKFDIKIKNIECWEDTKHQSSLIPPPPSSIKIQYDPMYQYVKNKNKSKKIIVHNMDTIDCAFLYENPLVLNLADDIYPGGWVNNGSCAQEESLFRRTNYHLSLVKELYPIMDEEVIYSPKITVIKDSDLTPINGIKQIDFVACPAIKYPFLTEDGLFEEEDHILLVKKIETIIQVANTYGHDTIIFGAMGCGAWENPPHEVANIFKTVLSKYDGCITNYIFAILDNISDDENFNENSDDKNESNYDIFKKVLTKKQNLFTTTSRKKITIKDGEENNNKVVIEKTRGGMLIAYTIPG